MLNYLKKFAVDIFPSVAATVIGAYIVNHYIVTKPGTAAPPAAAVATADSKGEDKPEAKPESRRMAAKPADGSAEVGNLPAAGVKARGISEKAFMEKTAAERPAVVEKPQAEAKAETRPDAKPADTPAETASTSAEPRRHQTAPREKEKIRVVLPSPVQPVPSAAATAQVASTPAVASTPNIASAPSPAAPTENAAAPEERRDANDLARAAIERLRSNPDISPRPAEAATVRAPEIVRPEMARPETSRVATAPATAAPALRPLPPPIMVSAPPSGEPAAPPRPPYAANVGAIDPQRPTPPAEIPLSRPLDLRAEAAEPSVRDRATAAAEDALSTAKSIFHAVLPK
jgi:hypothetical protein